MMHSLRSQFAGYNWTTINVVLLLALLFIVALFTGNRESGRTFDAASAAPEGLLTLRLWLEELGYNFQASGQMGFNLPSNSSETAQSQPDGTGALLLVFPGARSFSQSEAERLYQWVSEGNSVAFFMQSPIDSELQKRFEIDTFDSISMGLDQAVQPLVVDHREFDPDLGGYGSVLQWESTSSIVPVITNEDGETVLAVQTIGNGVAWYFSRPFVFINANLQERYVGAHFLPLLRKIPDGATIQIDNYHLFGSLLGDDKEITSIQGWLYYTSWGNATLFAALLIGIYLVLQGQRLGPPLPTQESLRRREAAEYVVAMANLYRRGNVTQDVASYQKQRLKQTLGRRLHLSSEARDADFVSALRAYDPRFDAQRSEQLSQLLHSLDQVDEASLVLRAAEVDQFIKEMN